MIITNKQYTDLPFFISKNPHNNDFNVLKNINAIKSSIKNLILTAPGERPFNPKFGSVFKTDILGLNTEDFLGKYTFNSSLYNSINLHENRIKDLNIAIEKDRLVLSFKEKTVDIETEMNIRTS